MVLPCQYRIDTNMLPTYDRIMNILKEKRKGQVLSQQDLANLSGVSKGTILRIENDRHKPNWVTLRKLAAALKCEASELVPLRGEN